MKLADNNAIRRYLVDLKSKLEPKAPAVHDCEEVNGLKVVITCKAPTVNDESVITLVVDTQYVPDIGDLRVISFTSSEGDHLASASQTSLTAIARGGTKPYEYKFIVYNSNSNAWYKIQDFSSENICDWYTGPVGNKTLYVDVKDATGLVVREPLPVTVT